MKQYPDEFAEDGAHGHCYRLLQSADGQGGVVLDLGCGGGPLAEPVAKLGYDYVGADIDAAAVAALKERGIEAHELDLTLPEAEIAEAISGILEGRRLSAVLLVDVVEHVVDPVAPLRVLARLAREHEALQVIVSIPNVTHVDMAGKLLLGRWDPTEFGLLDDTHVRFFDERLVRLTLARAGWVEVAAADVVSPYSDQLFPADTPALRPGVPLRELLRRIRLASDAHGETYQFVRRFEYQPEPAAELLNALEAGRRDSDDFLLTVGLRPGVSAESVQRVLQDLARQSDDGASAVEVLAGLSDGDDLSSLVAPQGLRLRTVECPADGSWADAVVAEARGRYVTFVDHRTRLRPGYVAAVRASAAALPARVVQLGVATAVSADLDDNAAGEQVDLDPLDLVSSEPLGMVVLDAYALPRQVFESGLRAGGHGAESALVSMLLRCVELCGVVRSAEPVLVVHPSALESLGEYAGDVAEELGKGPMVIPEGAGSQLLELRRRLTAALAECRDLKDELDEARSQVGVLAANLHQRESDRRRRRTR